jgi:CYTH domain-containing protein
MIIMAKHYTAEETRRIFAIINNSLKGKMKPKAEIQKEKDEMRLANVDSILKTLPVEIEHKFVINPTILFSMYPRLKPKFLNIQGYIQTSEPGISQMRIGILTFDDHTLPASQKEVSVINIKGNRFGASRVEFEIPCEMEQALKLLSTTRRIIRKYRYHFWYEGLTWFADEYLGNNEGLWIAEVEIPSEDFEFKVPEFVIKDVTEDERYYNKNLVNNPYCKWKEM